MIPEAFDHTSHPPVRNVNALVDEHLTRGQRAADTLARAGGSWGFILFFCATLIAWIIINTSPYLLPALGLRRFDKPPFILLNLVLSCLAAIQAPIILMSQNRQAQRDRIDAHHDYEINKKAEREVRTMMEHLEEQSKMLQELMARHG